MEPNTQKIGGPSQEKTRCKKLLCDVCEGKPESFCVDCGRCFCEECLELIHEPTTHQNHKVTSLEMGILNVDNKSPQASEKQSKDEKSN